MTLFYHNVSLQLSPLRTSLDSLSDMFFFFVRAVKFDRPETIRDRANMNLASHRFEP